jgi:hypothetical protein
VGGSTGHPFRGTVCPVGVGNKFDAHLTGSNGEFEGPRLGIHQAVGEGSFLHRIKGVG